MNEFQSSGHDDAKRDEGREALQRADAGHVSEDEIVFYDPFTRLMTPKRSDHSFGEF